MWRVTLFCLMTLSLRGLILGPAEASLPGPDAFGLYFDQEAAVVELDVDAGTSFPIYLILTNPTMNAIEGWESAVILTNGNSVTTTEFPVGSQPLLSGPQDWAVSMTTPMPCNVLTKLAVFTVLAVTDQHAPLYLGNIAGGSVDGNHPAVQVVGSGWTAVQVSSGDPDLPVAALNGSTPETKSSWGDVKSLFR